jgi:hypothetical protein
LAAVDLLQGKFKLSQRKSSFLGTFTPFMQDRMIVLLGQEVKVTGIAEYKNHSIKSMRAFEIESVDLND